MGDSAGTTTGGSTTAGAMATTGTGASNGGGSTSASTSSSGTTTGGVSFSCHLGDGGLFGDALLVSTGLTTLNDVHPIDVGDVNGDGKLDIVVADWGSGDVVVLFGNGDGTFGSPVHSQVPVMNGGPSGPSGPSYLHIALLGWPPQPTVVLADTAAVSSILVESVQPTGELSSLFALDAATDARLPYGVIADFNLDGIPDLATMADLGFAAYLGNDAGGLVPTGQFLPDVWCWADCIGDFNEDGIPDVLALPLAGEFSNELWVHLGRGDGTFDDGGISSSPAGLPSHIDPGSENGLIRIGDLNEDGHLDLLYQEAEQGACAVYFGRGDGTFIAGPVSAFPAADSALLGDLNGDGHLDFVSGDLFALGNGDGTFQAQVLLNPIAADISNVVLGDVNNDGRPDIIVSDLFDADVHVFLNNCH